MGISTRLLQEGEKTHSPLIGAVPNAGRDAETPALRRAEALRKVWQAILETKPLVSRAQFLAGEAIPCPGDSLEAIGGNIVATRFAHAVSSTGTTC